MSWRFDRPALPSFVAVNCLLVACSLKGFDDGGVRPPDAANLPDGFATASDGGPGCPVCETIVTGQDHPTELLFYNGDLYWIRGSATGYVVKSDSEGHGVVANEDHPISNGHDLVPMSGDVYALSDDVIKRFFSSYSTCTNPDGIKHLAAFSIDEALMVKEGTLGIGGCGDPSTIVNDNITAVVGDGTFASAVNYTTAAGPLSIAVSDFNSDGNQDLAVANFSANSISSLRACLRCRCV